MARPIFLDNTVLFYFGLVERADLLYALWGEKVSTTEAVMREYQAGVSVAGVSQDAWEDLPVVQLSDPEQLWIAELPPFLGAGEAACLAAAVHRNGAFASDDRKARNVARSFDLPVIGTVGILLRCIEAGLLTIAAAQELLDKMIAAGYRSPIQDLIEIL